MADVMLVEDEADIRDTLCELLQEEGMRVLTARHGQEALGLLERGEQVSVLVVDGLMPVMNGIELIDRLRASQRWAGLPVIFLSASTTVTPPDGVVVLRKPIALDKLIETIRAARR
jgi:CheY-like chemotaxis protein